MGTTITPHSNDPVDREGEAVDHQQNGIDVMIDDPLWADIIDDPQALVHMCHAEAVRKVPALCGSAAILFANDSTLQRLNATFRGKDKPTNVLSFPSGLFSGPSSGSSFPSGPFGEPIANFLGDIAIARETCVREAAELNKPVRDHTAHLIVHGLLHLIGLDHQADAEAKEMETMEAIILKHLGFAAPYDDNPDMGDSSKFGGADQT